MRVGWTLGRLGAVVIFLALAPCDARAQLSVEARALSSSDDADQRTNGNMDLGSDALGICDGGMKWVGVRFQNLAIPVGAMITDAYVEIKADASGGASPNATIFGEDVDNAATFSSSSNNISSRTATNASVAWSIPSWTAGQLYQTPDIKAIVQEIVDRGGWASGNDIVILFRKDSGNNREAVSYDNDSSNAPLLHVEYTMDLLGHWMFDEASGTTAADASDNNNDGTLYGTFTFASDAVTVCPTGSSGLEFDGTSDYIAVPNAGSLQPTSALTILGWVKGASWGSGANVNVVARKGESDPNNYQLAIADGQVALYLDDSDGVGIRGDTYLETDTWYHVAATWDGAEVRIYVNGELDHTPVARTGTIGTDTRDLYLGGRSGADLFHGSLDELRIYNRALTPGEISTLYGLVARWKLDETSGATAADASGRGHDGTLYGGFSFDTASVSPSKVDRGLEFDGSDDYISTPSTTSLQITNAMAITGWIRANTWGSGDDIDVIARKGEDDPKNYQLGVKDGRVTLFLEDDDGAAAHPGDTVLSPGTWYHVAGTWDGTDVRIYVDGVLDNSLPDTFTGSLGTDSRPLYVGGRAGTDLFDGVLDDVRIYDRALCAEEIFELFGSGSPIGIRIQTWIEIP